MLPYFPILYEDELLYSWFARYHIHTANIKLKQTMYDLFGKRNMVAVPDLPTNLNELSKRLECFQIPDLENLIKNHTFFRYYTTFTSEETKIKVLKAMKDNEKQALHLFLGIVASSIKENSYFMFCPKCQSEDMENKGEVYWKLEHQLPGILICLKHENYLLNSSVKFRADNKHEYIAAEFNKCKSVNVKTKLSKKSFLLAKELAKQVETIMTSDYEFSIEDIQSSYKFLLKREGFVSINGHVDQRLLSEKFLNYYGQAFLEEVQSSINKNSESCWLKSITRKHRKIFHPIRHLLLIKFLGETVETFYSYAGQEVKPFGEGPYYCLNPAADHYKQKIIASVSMKACTSSKKPVGTFKCECGFIYSRRGPDTSNKDLFKIGRIKQYGPVWKNKLNYLFISEKKTYTEISKILNCDRGTVKKYLENPYPNVRKDNLVSPYETVEKRKLWLELLANNPGRTVTAIRKLQPNIYTWLYRNDKEWLKNHSPILNKRNSIDYSRVDWSLRDEELLGEVFTIIPKLYQLDKPVHINISRIGKEIGKLHTLEKNLDKLPKTKEYLLRNVETLEQFQIRRVHWAAELLLNQKGYITGWEIKRFAGLKESICDEIKEVIENVVVRKNVIRKEEYNFGEN